MLYLVRLFSLVTFFLLYLTGCAANLTQQSDYLGIAKDHVEATNWKAAYRFLEDVPEKDLPEAKALINKNPKIIQEGISTFSLASLQSSIDKYGLVDSYDIELKRLSYLRRYVLEDQYATAESNILLRYDESDIQNEIEKRAEEWDKVEYGYITAIQIADESIYNKGIGTAVGQVSGSAAYADKAFSGSNWDYSATKHVAAALIGGLIGHAIEGDTEISYHVRYSILLAGGDSIFIGSHQVRRFYVPKGTCIKVKRRTFIEVVNKNLCEKLGAVDDG